MGQAPDYYAVLGVSRDATPEQIKRAYRRLARQCHPDVAGGDPAAEERFKQLTEAYRVLSDPELRTRYDLTGQVDVPVEAAEPGYADDLFSHLFDLVDTMFGMGGPARTRRRVGVRGRDVQVQVEVRLDELLTGTAKEITYQRVVLCDECRGTGCADGHQPQPCSTCRGRGQVRYVQQSLFAHVETTATCPRCRGKGFVVSSPCKACKGRGFRQRSERLTVEIPAGTEDASVLVLEGYGDYPPEPSGRPGDLHVAVRVLPHPIFRRAGPNLVGELQLDPAQAALGCTITVEGLDGEMDVRVPPGTQPGQEIVVRGRGLPDGRGRRGDVVFSVSLIIPRPRTERERQLLRELARLWGRRRDQRQEQ